jgi:hypothetical protein
MNTIATVPSIVRAAGHSRFVEVQKLARCWYRSLIAVCLLTVTVAAQASTIWTGPMITFTRPLGADPTTAAVQDRMTANVWLTRGDTMGLYNAKTQKAYIAPGAADTEWAMGTTADLPTLTFKPWVTWAGNSPPSTVGKNAVVHLITDDIYIDIKFTSWAQGGGGSFAYTRSTAATTTTPAVEYFYADWGYYFVTAFPDEIALLDGGALNGNWKRTGQTFNVWPQNTSTSSPTCRFFTTQLNYPTRSSHFYTPFPAECDTVKQNPNWAFESIAFYIQLAAADGTCSGGTIPLYRAYNNGMGGAPNHRYTTSLTTLNQMVAAGWVFEGDANTKVFACVPQ